MATLSSPDSDDPLGIGKKMNLRRRQQLQQQHAPQIIISRNNNSNNNNNNNNNINNNNDDADNHNGHHPFYNGNGKGPPPSPGKLSAVSASDKLAHKHVEDSIETFLETFKHKTWVVESARTGLLDRRASSDSGDSSGWTSSALSTTDDLSTDSPDRDAPDYVLAGVAGGAVGGAGVGAGANGSGSSVGGDGSVAGSVSSTKWQDREGIIAESRRIARWAWRQSHFVGAQDTPCACTYHPPRSVMEEVTQHYRVMDVAHLLQSKYVLLSGGKAKNGAPIMTFPARPGQPEVPDEDYGKVVTYLCGIVPLHEAEGGFVLVIDRRQDGWGAVKSILLKLSAFFPAHIQVVFLLQPKGFFQRAFSDFRSKFVKEDLEFKVVLCDGSKEMDDYIEVQQLTKDVGGELDFDCLEWTEHRSAVEKFSKNTAAISSSLSGTVKKMEQRELPNDVTGTEAILRVCMAERKELLEDINSATAHCNTLLKCIRGEQPFTPINKLCHVLELERLLVQLEESQTGFGEFWTRHESYLQQTLALRRFEEEFKLAQFSMERRIEELEGQMEEYGNSVSQVENLLKEFEKLEEESQTDIDIAVQMRTRGQQLIMDEHYAVDSIRPKCLELQRMYEQYKDLLRKRREVIAKSHDLQDRLERANRWCSTGVDLLASQPVDKLHTSQGAQSALNNLERYRKTASELKLSNPREFRQLFEQLMTPDNRATVQSTLKRMEDVHRMCDKRKESLLHIIDPRPRPVQQVNPEPNHHHHATTHRNPREISHHKQQPQQQTATDNTDGSNKGKDGQRTQIYLAKSVRYRPDPNSNTSKLDNSHQNSERDTLPSELPSPLDYANSQSAASDASSVSTSDTQRSSLSSASMTSFPESDDLQARRRPVMAELIETEVAYVNELHQILQGYYYEMDKKSLQMMIPPPLLGHRDTLFGNLPDIYRFHKDIFLQELKNCRDDPSKVGKCFVNRREEFQMYSIYCQNKPRSEALRTSVGDSNPFFKECQNKLGHRLPLGAYLLKPIQRITKYQLLLKEMLRFAGNNSDLKNSLQEAKDTMLSVLAYLNDSMHQVNISGFTESITELGRLLLHGSFRVWTEHKHERMKGLRLRPMQRHVFLYHKTVLLCKKREESNSDQPSYAFKNKLKLTQVGLTEKIKGDKRKFELWLRGREEVYIIQAPDLEMKNVWVAEIKRVLMTQFDQLKESRQPAPQSSMEDITQTGRISSDSSDYSLDNWKSKGSTLPVGLEMSSPLVTPTSPPYHMDEDVDVEEEEDDDEAVWSSGEFSNTDEESPDQYIPKIEPSYKEHFVSLGDYDVVDPNDLALSEGDCVEVMRVGKNGWWYARHLTTHQEGWVPSTYLESVSRVSSMYSSSDSLSVPGTRSDMSRSRSESPYHLGLERTSVPETTV